HRIHVTVKRSRLSESTGSRINGRKPSIRVLVITPHSVIESGLLIPLIGGELFVIRRRRVLREPRFAVGQCQLSSPISGHASIQKDKTVVAAWGSIGFFWRSGNSLRCSGFVTYVEVNVVEDEQILIERLRARDEAAFTELVERYYGYLLPLADFFVSNRA